MIILDLETTGTSPSIHCMASLGAVDFETNEEFYIECHVPEGKTIDPFALSINGFTIEQLKDFTKPSPHDAYFKFLEWASKRTFPGNKLLGGHNVGHFDILFLEYLHQTAGFLSQTKFPFSYRTLDLHSVAFAKFGKSLTHEQICLELGLPPEPKPHNALQGARSEAAAFRILLKNV